MTATRTVILWLDSEEPSYREAVSLANEALKQACDNESHARTARNDAVEALASNLEDFVCASMPCCKGLWGDLVSHALAAVDFEEVAKHYLEDLEIWAVHSSESEDADLFTSKEDARDHLAGMLDDDNTMHAGPFLKLTKLEAGESVEIDGVTYTLECA